MRQKLLARLASMRLQRILIFSFILMTAVTIFVSTQITLSIINRYLADSSDERVGRDMKLAEAFYDLKRQDLASGAQRMSASPTIRDNLRVAVERDPAALQALRQELDNEISVLSPDKHRFIILVDAQGMAVDGRVTSELGRTGLFRVNTDWSQVAIVKAALASGQSQTAPEILPADVLEWLGLASQARIDLVDTPGSSPVPYDPQEGTAGLVLMAVAPVTANSPGGDLIGAVVIGHLINQDYTLVDRIKEVAGVDTSTIFQGDMRVSTNVPNEKGERAIGTRVSQAVYDTVLTNGQDYTGRALVVNQWYITRYTPLRDHTGAVIGILYVGAKEASFQRLVDSFRRWLLLIAGASVILAAAISIPVAWSISRPLSDLAHATRQVAEGDWSVRAPTYGRSEMGILAGSFNTMVETLRDTHEQLLQKEKLASLGQLAAGVAHEINNPLGSVLLYADILCRDTPADDHQRRDDLQMIIKEATRCKTIVTDLLNFSRQKRVLAQKTDLAALLQTIIAEASQKPSHARISLSAEIDPALPEIEADPLQLNQVFLNLMNNAVDAMPDGGSLILRAQKGPQPGFVTVQVQDTGTGISKENMSKLFTPFFTTKPIGTGTGLGLAIAYGIVKMHQGQISVHSVVGQGTTFTITLREKLPSPEVGQMLSS
jgi:two-component system, NtrC family, sensor kinase